MRFLRTVFLVELWRLGQLTLLSCEVPANQHCVVFFITIAAMERLESRALIRFLRVAPVISCQLMFASPFPTIAAIARAGTTAKLPPMPYKELKRSLLHVELWDHDMLLPPNPIGQVRLGCFQPPRKIC